jgi:2,4-dienoyl-CoA reductase-like NADH-dependent reductase (Old Yellow Enzyme family)
MTPARRSPSMLFSPFQLRDVRFPNRIVIGPMQMYVASADGMANDWHFQHLAKYAVGGAGAVMTEALIVDPIGRNTYADCGIWSDAHVPALKRIGSGRPRTAGGSSCANAAVSPIEKGGSWTRLDSEIALF